MVRTARVALAFVVCSLVCGCGGKVVVDGGGGASSSDSSASSDSSTTGSPHAECPFAPMDLEISGLVGKPCDTGGAICASNNGCGGCSVTCTGGIWTSTNAELCFSVGTSC